ncbi:MAG: PaaI family thioesterase [Proteobacteria bacterium]|nr:MAG: PaaI family thioesterase [Pseudomonadota bacterium]
MEYETKLEAIRPDWQPIDLPYVAWVRSFVSGDPKGERIRVRFFQGKEDGVLWGRVWFGPAAEGPPGFAHGGAQAAVLDELLGGTAWVFGNQVIALNLQTDFVSFVPLQVELVLKGQIVSKDGRKIFTEGTIEDISGKVLARGKILFLQLSDDQVAKLLPNIPKTGGVL